MSHLLFQTTLLFDTSMQILHFSLSFNILRLFSIILIEMETLYLLSFIFFLFQRLKNECWNYYFKRHFCFIRACIYFTYSFSRSSNTFFVNYLIFYGEFLFTLFVVRYISLFEIGSTFQRLKLITVVEMNKSLQKRTYQGDWSL